MSPSLSVSVLAVLWVSLGRCGGGQASWPGCDSGKMSQQRDLPQDAVWVCPVSSWTQSTERHPAVDTVYDPQPASQVCVDKPIDYNHIIPNSGAYRPWRAESGEYLFCPPQRWLNNLHHGATVLLYHPCVPPRERAGLTALARACLSNYIVSPHPELSEHTPIALVSWGRTLELSTVAASSDVCDWLEKTKTGQRRGDMNQERRYNLLLLRPAEKLRSGEPEHQHTFPEKNTPQAEGSVRHCCEQTLFPYRDEGMDGTLDTRMARRSMREERTRRKSRAASRENQETVEKGRERGNIAIDVSSSSANMAQINILSSTGQDKTSGAQTESPPQTGSSSEPRLRKDPLIPRTAPPLPGQGLLNQSLKKSPINPAGLHAPKTLNTHAPLRSRSSEPQKLTVPSKLDSLKPNPEPPNAMNIHTTPGTKLPAHGGSSKHNLSAAPQITQTYTLPPRRGDNTKEGRTVVGQQTVNNSTKQIVTETKRKAGESETGTAGDNTTGEKVKGGGPVDVREREALNEKTQGTLHSNSEGENARHGGGDTPKLHEHPEPLPQPHHRPHAQLLASYPFTTPDCGSCEPDGQCSCTEGSGPQGRAPELAMGMPRTPRTDEAVWAAAALGFLLILLALSVLHTRLHRHWRTTPSLYWHDPQQDYDSVADVIRRRLRIVERRRKRRTSQNRRKECVLLPSSSSSDDDQ